MEDRDIDGLEIFDDGGLSSTSQASQSGEKLKCSSCGYFTYNKYYLKQHTSLVHSPERPFRCPFCDYAGKRSHSLKEHLIVHSNERPYECNQCNATFRKKGHLTNHTKMHSNPITSYSECRLCRATFDQRSDLYIHLRTIHSLSSFQCSFCEYATTIKSNLIMHENGHADKSKIKIMAMKPKIPPGALVILKCTACGFETSDKHVFEVHMVDHAGTMAPSHGSTSADPFQPLQNTNKENKHQLAGTEGNKCAECDFTSVDAYTFLTHVLSHKPVVPNSSVSSQSPSSSRSLFTQDAFSSTFCCNICGYVCDSQRTIKAHVWKHSGHRQLEYPTFQNGPLSIYDGTLLGRENVKSLLSEAVNARPKPLVLPVSAAALSITNRCADKISAVGYLAQPGRESDLLQDAQPSSASYADGAEPTKSQPKVDDVAVYRDSSKQLESKPLSVPQQHTASLLMTKVDGADSASPAPTAGSTNCIATPSRSVTVAERQDSAITLLSLLKKGPNFNPACPSVSSSLPGSFRLLPPPPPKRQKLADEQKDCTLPVKPSDSSATGLDSGRRGICSSLLAVIEQLRESSDTEEVSGSCGDGSPPLVLSHGTKTMPATTSGGLDDESSSAAATSAEALDCLPNIERVVGGGHRCRLCHYSASPGNGGAALLVQHMKTHKSRQPFGCTLCDHVAASNEALQAHVISHCKMRTYQCKQCPTAFNYKSQLRAHVRMHDDCPSSSEQRHQQPVGPGKVAAGRMGCAFACPSCSYSASSVNLLRCHLRVAHGCCEESGDGFRCTACQVVFASLEEVSTHTCPTFGTVQLASGLHRAEDCSGRHSAASVPADDTVPTDACGSCATMKCEQCDFVALSARSLKSHLKRHLNDKRYVEQPLEQYKCNMCGYVCHHLPSLKSHMWRHASDKEYSYQSANAAINAAIDHDAGVRGVAASTAPRDHLNSCDRPSEAEESKSTLVAFRCCQCGFETVDKATLNTHMKEHSDVIRKTLSICVDVHS